MSRPPSSTATSADVQIGSRIRARREELKLTQSEAAKRVGVQRRQYWAWEHGKSGISRPNLERLADVLQCSGAWLIVGYIDATDPVTGLTMEQAESTYRALSQRIEQLENEIAQLRSAIHEELLTSDPKQRAAAQMLEAAQQIRASLDESQRPRKGRHERRRQPAQAAGR